MSRWLRLGLHVAGLVLLVGLLWYAGPAAWRQVLAGEWGAILVAFLLTGLANMLSASRLRLVSRSGNLSGSPPVAWRRYYHLTMVANALGLVLPRSLSTVGGKAVGLRSVGVPFKRAVALVFLDNAFDLALLGALVLPSLFFLRGRLASVAWSALLLLFVLGLGAAMAWLGSGRLAALAGWLAGRPGAGFLRRFEPERLAALFPGGRAAWPVYGLTVAINALLAVRFYYVAQAVALPYPWLLFLAAFPLTQLSLVLGGLGFFDASWYGVLLLAGVASQDALTFVVAQRAYVLLFILAWTAVSLLLSLTVRGGERGNGEQPVNPARRPA
ncbi:MAG: flippase-like domain-containing protein, partial [Chloroflexi bacterium]|nr:flippase-like domain-containing protein [Chloroflexota bacterium]